jgi:hypothetical protein
MTMKRMTNLLAAAALGADFLGGLLELVPDGAVLVFVADEALLRAFS